MSEWLNQIRNHKIHDDIRAIISSISQIKLNTSGFSGNTLENIDRISYVISELNRRLTQTDPLLIPISPLSSMNGALRRILQYLGQFQRNQNAQEIEHAHNELENILTYLVQIPSVATAKDLENVLEAAINLRQSAGDHLKKLDDEFNATLERSFSLNQSFDSLELEFKDLKESVDSLIKEFNDKFEEFEKKHQETFEEALNKFELESKKLHNGLRKLETDAPLYFHAVTERILEDLNNRKKEVEEIVGAIATTGLIGGYKHDADFERKRTTIWQVTTVALLLGLIGFSISFFIATFKNNFQISLPLFLTRSLVILSIIISAGYAALQADRHSRAHRRHRKMELELAAITPYLYEIPINEAHKIKTDLAMRIFGQQDSFDTKETNANSLLNTIEILGHTIKNLTGK